MIDNPSTRAALLLIGRVLLVAIYVIGGVGILKGQVPVDYAATKGVPAALVWIGYAIKFFGGLAVLIGFYARLGAFGLVLFTLGTAFIFHPYPDMVFMKEISMIGGLIAIMAVGPGAYSIDERGKG